METTYSLYVNDELIADNLTMNGSNYVSTEEVVGFPTTFKLTVKDDADNIIEEHEHAKLLQQVQYAWDDNKFYLAFAPVSEQEIKNNEFKSNLQYLAMMADVDIDL